MSIDMLGGDLLGSLAIDERMFAFGVPGMKNISVLKRATVRAVPDTPSAVDNVTPIVVNIRGDSVSCLDLSSSYFTFLARLSDGETLFFWAFTEPCFSSLKIISLCVIVLFSIDCVLFFKIVTSFFNALFS